jgi:hypothetical protein
LFLKRFKGLFLVLYLFYNIGTFLNSFVSISLIGLASVHSLNFSDPIEEVYSRSLMATAAFSSKLSDENTEFAMRIYYSANPGSS